MIGLSNKYADWIIGQTGISICCDCVNFYLQCDLLFTWEFFLISIDLRPVRCNTFLNENDFLIKLEVAVLTDLATNVFCFFFVLRSAAVCHAFRPSSCERFSELSLCTAPIKPSRLEIINFFNNVNYPFETLSPPNSFCFFVTDICLLNNMKIFLLETHWHKI